METPLNESLNQNRTTLRAYRHEVQEQFSDLAKLSDGFRRTMKGTMRDVVKEVKKGRATVGSIFNAMFNNLVKNFTSSIMRTNISLLSKSIKQHFSSQKAPIAVPNLRSQLPHFHQGGIAGQNELLAVLNKDEEVLTRSDPRHRHNLGRATNAVLKIDARGADPVAIGRLYALLPKLRQLAAQDVLTVINNQQRRIGK